MNNFKKLLSFVIVLSMVLALAACGNNREESKESSSGKDSSSVVNESTTESSKETESAEREHVELSLYTYSSLIQPGKDEAFEEINKYLKEKLNTTVDFHIYQNKEYDSTVGTMISSGADGMDIIFTRQTMVPFLTYVNMNAFLPLEDYRDEYLSGTETVVPEASWDAVTVDGHLYAVPLPRDSATMYNVQLNTTMMDDLGLTFPEEEYHTYWDVIDFLYEAKTARDKKYPDKASQPIVKDISILLPGYYNVDQLQGNLCYTNVPGLFGFEGMGEGETAFCPFLTDDYREFCKMIAQLVKDGIIPFDTKSYDPDKVLFKNGEFIMDDGLGTIFLNEEAYLPAFRVKLVKAQDAVLATGGLQHGYAISAKSKNVERALEVIDLINTDEYLATLLHFGPEGIGWTDNDNDGMIELTQLNSDSTNRYYYQWYQWQLGGLTATKVPPAACVGFADLLSEMNNAATPASNLGFVLDTETIVNEIAACNNVVKEYHDGILVLGQNEDVDKICDEFAQKLKDNGIEKIVNEIQTQLTAWRTANGK